VRRLGRTPGRRLLLASLLIGTCMGAPGARADEDAARSHAWLDQLDLNGLLTTSWSYNFNRPASGTNQLRVFDFDDNTFKVDVLELVAQKAVSKPGTAGFRADLALGSSVPKVSSAAGLFRDTSGTEDLDLQQAYASYNAPLGSGLRFDLGKFVTHFGYEVIEGYDGWNDNVTHSFLFGFAIPFTHTGARVAYAFSPRVSALAVVVNGWDVARDNNRSKSVGGQLALAPSPSLSIVMNGMWGPERSDQDSDARTLLDLVSIWKPFTRLTLGVNGDWGSEPGAVVAGQTARWDGVALYARFQADGFALTGRAERFNDHDGARTGVEQRLSEVTLTPEWRLGPRLLVRSDLRIDHSTREVFETDTGVRSDQPTVLLQALYAF